MFEFFHLIVVLVRWLNKEAPPPTRKFHRKVELDPIVMECPACGALALSLHQRVEALQDNAKWKPVHGLLVCGTCHQSAQASDFENDGSGVMRLKMWNCTQCQTKNPGLKYVCMMCGVSRFRARR